MSHRSPVPLRLAIVASHPIQYYAPWFADLTRNLSARLRVFYLWDFGVAPTFDRGFEQTLVWDIDLLAGHDFCFVPNIARQPGTHHFRGLDNPGLVPTLLDWKPDAILLFGYNYWSHLRVITSRRLRKIPLLFRGDSHRLAGERSAVRRALKRIGLPTLFRRFSAFLSVGSAHTAYLRNYGVPEAKIFHSPHAIDNTRFSTEAARLESSANSWRIDLGIPADHQVVLFAGKFEPRKRPDDLVSAFIEAAVPRTTLLLVGSGELAGVLRRRVQKGTHILLVPFQNQSRMPLVYAASDLLVLPSTGPGESWGLVVNEAFACGKPAIVSDHVGCGPDLIRPRQNGLVFPAGDQSALVSALRDALSYPARLLAWGKEAQQTISSYDYAAAAHGLQRALSSLPASPQRAERL